MNLCVVSCKKCWQEGGRWMTAGGFPMQMRAVASLFDEMTLLLVAGRPESGGSQLPEKARVVLLKQPAGTDWRRKRSVIAALPYYLIQMVRHCRRADVVHTPLPGDLPLLGMLVALLFRRKLVARYGGSWLPTDETTPMNRVTQACMRRIAGGRNVMLATGGKSGLVAPSVHWLFATALSRPDLERMQRDVRQDAAPQSPARLVFVGRLSPEKGLSDLIRSMALLNGNEGGKPLAHLTLIGGGPERGPLEAQVRESGLEEHVTFAGQLAHAEALSRLALADLCVLPSLSESFCKARLDALACGVPVVTTEVGFGREIVGEDGERGWIVPAANAEALARQIRVVLCDTPDWQALRSRCRSFAAGRTLEAWSERIGTICSEQWKMRLVNGKIR